MRLALFEPDIPQNAATLIRTAACLGIAVDVIEPCGFIFSDRNFRRAGMDYLDRAAVTRHASWRTFNDSLNTRMILLTTAGDTAYADFVFAADDTLLVGRESAGVPPEVHAAADARVMVPMCSGERSLNVAVAAAMVLGEAMRQTTGFPA